MRDLRTLDVNGRNLRDQWISWIQSFEFLYQRIILWIGNLWGVLVPLEVVGTADCGLQFGNPSLGVLIGKVK